ncbi:unnamed protein product [Mytilus edulis]|uniref:Integrase catalytic domain-containing protein n=1 Tax=Mytilus edulis TaxID=6550 RepID=A0A8S3URG9_MYTED|nr:unnamed protein product [Mytilus edulis]
MMEIRPDGSFAEPNDLKVTNEKTNEDADVMLVTENGKIEMTQILNEFESIFEGIGKIRDYRNDSELYVKFSMKPGIAPIAQKPRQVPYYLQEPLKQWLEEGVKSDIFEEVPSGTPVQWCSPLVVLPKPKFSEVDKDKLEPHMIRACVDMRIPNKFMERNRIIQSPVVEDFIYKFHKCKEHDETERVIKAVIHNEHAVILERLQEETNKDEHLIKLKDCILKTNWERNKKDMDIIPYYHMRNELYVAEGLVFRLNQIIVPKTLQEKVINAAHKMGHFGMTKTKQMLRERYWFPTMNAMVEENIKHCFECQVTTKQQGNEPLKMTEIPENPWEVVSVDFGGPYPDGHYNLVVIDKRTRYPEVEKVNTTACKQTKDKLMRILATHGIPKRLESDNGPPFNSVEFANFAAEQGFEHHKITPLHPRANGEAEAFMKVLNKTEKIAKLQNRDSAIAVQEMLVGYRSTPHPATDVQPYEALVKRRVRTKLGYIPRTNKDEDIANDKKINEKDKSYKDKIKHQAENRNTRKHNLKIGDYVLLEQNKRDKWTTAYEPAFYVVFVVNGSTIGARRVTDGREIRRDASKFKIANKLVKEEEYGPPQDRPGKGAEDTEYGPPARQAREGADWREELLRNTEQKNNINNEQSLNQLSNQRPQRERRGTRTFNDYIMSRR